MTGPGEPVETPAEEAAADRIVLLLGTAHVVPLRTAIQHHIFDFKPGAVALELDRDRLEGLLARPEDRERPGFGYGLVQRFQERIASDLGGVVGDEMLAAREAAMLLGVPVALVDRPAQQTVQRLIAEMGWGERLKLVGSVVASIVPWRKMDEELQRALDGDPELVAEVGRRFPTVKRVLIDERDVLMADRLAALARAHGRVVAIVGDAHVPGMVARLDGQVDEVLTVRVKELSKGTPARFGFSVKKAQD